jgi:hypothetical protein
MPIDQKPFKKKLFEAGDITYLEPRMNQTHQLENVSSDMCITLQTYKYPNDDDAHYETFDFVRPNGHEIEHFKPSSDMDLNDFANKMSEEWHQWSSTIVRMPAMRYCAINQTISLFLL